MNAVIEMKEIKLDLSSLVINEFRSRIEKLEEQRIKHKNEDNKNLKTTRNDNLVRGINMSRFT